MDQESINRVIRLTRSSLPKFMDFESVAIDIIVESWSNKIEHPSRAFIKNRCRDMIRSYNREQAHLERKSYLRLSPMNERDVDTKLETNRLMGTLNVLERKVIWTRFYKDLSIEEGARDMGLSIAKFRETLLGALFKMKQASEE